MTENNSSTIRLFADDFFGLQGYICQGGLTQAVERSHKAGTVGEAVSVAVQPKQV